MIPVSLTIKGLYSYQYEQTIEFDRLLEGQLFGIFGGVGSGKSSILEAISFALYGQTERLDNRDNRNYNMMNLKSNELLIDFTFRNFDKQLYRFRVKGKRHGKDFEKVNTFDRAGYRWNDGEWYPLESSLAEPIIGLSYDNFRRTIIIPQGKFQEFLQLGHSNRTQMLKEIFQLEKYEFFNQTKHIESKNNSALQHLTGQISIYAEIQAERIEEKKGELQGLSELLRNKTNSYDLKLIVLKDLLALKDLFENLAIQKGIVSNLTEKKVFFKDLEAEIRNLEYCIIHFESGLNRLKELKEAVKAKEISLMQTQAFHNDVVKEIETLNKPFEDATKEFFKQDFYKEKLQDYHHLIRLVKLSSDRYKLEERIGKGKSVVNELLTKKIDIENRLTFVKKELRDKNDLKPNIKELIDLRTWFDKNHTLEELLKSAIKEKKRFENEVVILKNGLLSLIKSHDCFKKVENNLEELNTKLIKFKEDKELEIRTLKDEIEHFHVQLKLGEFTDALKRGEACPLCGSLKHAFVLEVENVQLYLQKSQTLLSKLELEYIGFQDLINEFQLYAKKNDFINDQIIHVQKQIDECQRNILKHRSAFNWEDFDFDSYSRVLELITEGELVELAIQDLGKRREDYQENLTTMSRDFDRYNESLERLRNEFQACSTEFSTLTKQLKHYKERDIVTLDDSYIQTRSEQITLKISIDKKRYEELSNSLIKLREQELKLSVQIESITSGLREEKESFVKNQNLLEEKLKVSPYESWEDVHRILKNKIDLDKGKEQVNNYKVQIYSAKDSLDELIKKTVGKSFDQAKYDTLLVECNEMKEEIVNLNDKYISGKSVLDSWVNQLSAKTKLLKELETLEDRHENIKTMRQLFMANGFVNYISTVYLQNLCHVANERFYRLTRQQLRLELGDKNEFLVRDFMNNGKLRSVKTLSGGQTFQASLCLALALAESVQHQNKSEQNFFFLDEGFGSLDKESLQMAFETLKSLRKENRIVGIISHVEELQQEIDIYLKVLNDPFTGSLITKSWEQN
jgi:exonuclease SbcC